MKISIQCNCGNKETIEIINGNSDYLHNFTLYSPYNDTKVLLECDKCKEEIEITII